ncbi:Hypoxic response protein 1 [archaeon HR01]|nr:Hypoxic response protein 1 [archaeon HR01]
MTMTTLRQLVKRSVISIDTDLTVHDVIKRMAEEDIGFLVVAEKGQVVGVLSERDVIKSLAEERNLDKKVGDLCRRDIIKLRDSNTVEEAGQVMGKHRIRHVVVVDEMDNLVGVVSARDILEELYSAEPSTD